MNGARPQPTDPRVSVDRPVDLLPVCVDSHRTLIEAVRPFTDAQARAPSLLPGWSRGHVITHLARKADSHIWLFEGAKAGEVRQQYPRPNMREEDIEAGAGRPAKDLVDDLRLAFGRIDEAFDTLPDGLWGREGVVAPGPRTMAEIVFRHLRDVEVHHVDLGLGYEPSDWPPLYIEGELRRRLPSLPDRADRAQLAAWLLGRGPAPELGPW